ncbi:MAG: ACT domain-containing protein [Xanthomonadales bacterium]|nr:ACT domain-containing protein [Xanthomonadales bacterium]
MQPVLNPGRYVFVTVSPDQLLDLHSIVASVREPEGLSVVLTEQGAIELGLEASYLAAWITLTVHSDLAAVGLTAAFSNALAQSGISCNVVAGNHHDHVFVPHEQAQVAMAVLQTLQASATV